MSGPVSHAAAQKVTSGLSANIKKFLPWEAWPVVAVTVGGIFMAEAIIYHKWIRHVKYEKGRKWLDAHKNSVVDNEDITTNKRRSLFVSETEAIRP